MTQPAASAVSAVTVRVGTVSWVLWQEWAGISGELHRSIMSFINDIMDKGKEFMEDQVEKGLNFIGQDGESLQNSAMNAMSKSWLSWLKEEDFGVIRLGIGAFCAIQSCPVKLKSHWKLGLGLRTLTQAWLRILLTIIFHYLSRLSASPLSKWKMNKTGNPDLNHLFQF